MARRVLCPVGLVRIEALGATVVERTQVERAGRTAQLKPSMVASRAPAGRVSRAANSGIDAVTTGGKTEGMKAFALLASTIEYAICPG